MNEDRRTRRTKNLIRYLKAVLAADLVLLAICLVLLMRCFYVEKQYRQEKERADALSADITSAGGDDSGGSEAMGQTADRTATVSDAGSDYLEGVRRLAEKGASAIDILKFLFPGKIIVADEGAYHFFDIDGNLKKNEYAESGYTVSSDGRVSYSESGNQISVLGVDVSQHNGEVDWEKVKASGVQFAYIRAGIRGYGSGKLVEDETFEANITGAKAAGLNVGVYFATQALNEDEAREEADFVLRLIADKGVNCPVAIDIEKIEEYETTPRTLSLSINEYTANVTAFCDRISEAGYEPIIYGNAKSFTMMLDMAKLENYQKWFADYVNDAVYTPEFPYAFRIWQFSCKGICDGISGKCDYNIAYY